MWSSLAHSFIVVKLLPQLSAAPWVEPYALQQVAELVTKPFLALRVQSADIRSHGDSPTRKKRRELYLISSSKPAGVDHDCYFTIRPSSPAIMKSTGRTLIVHPVLPFQRQQLYLHTFPYMLEALSRPLSDDGPSFPTQLDDTALKLLAKALTPDYHARMARVKAQSAPWTGGADAVLDGWDTWSGRAWSTDRLHFNGRYVFEYAPQEEADVENPTICDEMKIFNQLYEEYTVTGVTATINWVKQTRQIVRTSSHEDDIVNDATNAARWRDAIHMLAEYPIPYDGEPEPEESESDVYDWDDEPQEEILPVNRPGLPLPVKDIKVIVLDVFGTVFDRMSGIREGLCLLAGKMLTSSRLEQLTCRYVELEHLKSASDPAMRYHEIARDVLRDVSRLLSNIPSQELLEKALETILAPRLFPGANEAIKELHGSGYTVVGLVTVDEETYSRTFCQLLPPQMSLHVTHATPTRLYTQDTSLFSDLKRVSKSDAASIKPNNILVVTSGKHRVVEPAQTAGYPTVLVQQHGDLESRVVVQPELEPSPSLTIADLVDLPKILADPPPVPTVLQDTTSRCFAYRVKDQYQFSGVLGTGSFGTVVEAKHLLTGATVAIKSEIAEVDGQKPVVPYEAQIYRVLEGVHGVPSLRWAGVDRSSNVMIIDRLGPTVEQLRNLCRGKFSLRTVLMLADQMLQRLQDVHDRGIIMRDVKPDNFALGIDPDTEGIVHVFDFGFGKLYLDPVTGQHMPFREGRDGPGSVRYSGYNFHFGREQSRRDDMEALGNTLLFLLHGRLPWQGIYAASSEAKVERIGEMKAGQPLRDLIARSPRGFTEYFDHIRGLAFEERPDYKLLRGALRKHMEEEGWKYDASAYDWVDSRLNEKGTLVPGEYKLDVKFAEADVIIAQ